jgi:hypothetical protein
MPRRRVQPLPVRLDVCDDWIRALPREKGRLFEALVSQWERSYAMMSVALDDAMSLRARGELVCAHQQVWVSIDLLQRLSASLIGCCEILGRHGRGLDNMPAVEPMRTKFFRGDAGRSAASWNSILHHVLFGSRARFVHKVRILSETLAQIEEQFVAAVGELSCGISTQSDVWKSLDCLHYDFNTCLRESEVVLKSFLRVLPAEQLQGVSAELEAPLAPRRAAALAGTFPRTASA